MKNSPTFELVPVQSGSHQPGIWLQEPKKRVQRELQQVTTGVVGEVGSPGDSGRCNATVFEYPHWWYREQIMGCLFPPTRHKGRKNRC